VRLPKVDFWGGEKLGTLTNGDNKTPPRRKISQNTSVRATLFGDGDISDFLIIKIYLVAQEISNKES
jgi:hypothetical protein